MNEYIFYTTEGHTIAPISEVKVENCQVLGRAWGDNAEKAKEALLNKNPWINEAGFHNDKIIAQQLCHEAVRSLNGVQRRGGGGMICRF